MKTINDLFEEQNPQDGTCPKWAIKLAESYSDQFKPKWIFTEPKKDGPYLIAYQFGVTEGKFFRGRYLTADFQNELPEAYAHMPLPTKP